MLLGALSVGEKFSTGGITTLLGLGMTFVVLTLLIGCIYLVSTLLKALTKLLDEKKAAKSAAKQVVTEEVASDVAVEEKKDIDPETMVAIRSAVEIYLRENGGNNGEPHENITIKSVTKL